MEIEAIFGTSARVGGAVSKTDSKTVSKADSKTVSKADSKTVSGNDSKTVKKTSKKTSKANKTIVKAVEKDEDGFFDSRGLVSQRSLF
jgi:hypothetical protein